jgi:phosphatidylethanolamine/phosphatidyl-N-methylethanolamine N-methyltransferase
MQALHTKLDNAAVQKAYSRWAPVYDYSFGAISWPGRLLATSLANKHCVTGGKVLEVGVGTGLSLPRYKKGLSVTGIDLSAAMLAKAAARVRSSDSRMQAQVSLCQMDASRLGFAGPEFDATIAMYVMTVVPDAAAVMKEICRVTKPCGDVFIVNHFSREGGVRGFVEKSMAPFARKLGWHPVFPVHNVLGEPELQLIRKIDLTFGLFTLVHLRKD